MAYGTKYILPFTNELNEFYEIYFDFLGFVGAPIQITGTEECLQIISTTGDENKLEPILGQQATISIWVSENDPFTITDLIATHDNDIRVTVYKDQDYTTFDFQGFVAVEDNSQPFLDPPFALTVRALDGLGLLKGVDFVDASGNRFSGPMNIVYWVAQILYKTGQTLPIRTYFDFRNLLEPDYQNPLYYINLDATTFYTGLLATSTDPSVDVNAGDDCYTALEKIVRNLRCKLFQQGGCWHLINLYSYTNPMGYSYFEFNLSNIVAGIVQVTGNGFKHNLNFDVKVGKKEIVVPVKDDAVLYLKQLTKWEKLTYTYDQSLNKICNQDFTQGDRNTAYDSQIPSHIVDPTLNPQNENLPLQANGYDLFCWTHLDSNGPYNFVLFPTQPAAKRAFIRDVVDQFGYSIVRYVVIERTPTYGKVSFIEASSLLIDTGDVLQLGVDVRSSTTYPDESGSVTAVACLSVVLHGDDGNTYVLNDQTTTTGFSKPVCQWVMVMPDSLAYAIFLGLEQVNLATTWNHGDWNSNTLYPIAHAPVNGRVVVSIVNRSGDYTGDEMWFKNLTVTINPYLSGTYQQVKGDYNFTSSSNNIKQTFSEDIQISDSPKRYFKGALLQPGGTALLPATWKRINYNESLRFTQAMDYILYNNLYRINQKIEGSFRGLTYKDATNAIAYHPSGFLNSWFFTDSDTPDKKFLLTSYDKDYATGIWRGVFVEILKDANDTGFITPDTYVFNYLFQ